MNHIWCRRAEQWTGCVSAAARMEAEPRLASALGRKDEEPNIALAEEIVRLGDERSLVQTQPRQPFFSMG